MTATIPFVKPVSQIKLAPGSSVTIPNISWQEFEWILQELGENRSARVAYIQGILEIIVPLPEHEKPKELIADLVKTLLRASGRKYEPFGSTTFKQEGIAGVEPDACVLVSIPLRLTSTRGLTAFYIQNYRRMINRRRLQADDPPPDLAIECDVISKTTLDAYEAIGVPEVWIYDSGKLNIYLLQNQKYIASQYSPLFPQIELTKIIPNAIARSWQVGSVIALEELETAIREEQLLNLLL